MTNKPLIKKPSTVSKAVDGHGLSMKDYYLDNSTNNFERRDNPPEHISSSDLKVGSPEHKQKNPHLYGHRYVSKTEQALYPKLGTAPSEVAAAKKILNESGPVKYDKNGLPNKATPAQVGRAAENIERMRQMEGESNKPTPKKINAYADVKIPIPTINHSLLRNSAADVAKAAAIEKVRQYAFSKRPDPDSTRGLGSLANTVGRKLRAVESRRNWERNNLKTYENNHDKKK